MRGFGWWESVAQDLRFGVRMLLRRPVFSLVVISVLALGIGLNAAMFSIVEAVILRPLPYRDAKQLTIVWQSSPEHRATGEWFDTYRDFQEWQRRSRSFASLAALSWATGSQTAEWHGKRQRVLAIPVSDGFFSMLGVQAQYGRVFEPRDAAGGCAVVVSYAYWRDQLGADKAAPGRTLTLDQRACHVVGVMPERFSFYPRETSLWTVITPDSDFVRQPWKTPTGVFGRLRPGVSRAAAEQELAAIEASIAAERPREHGDAAISAGGAESADRVYVARGTQSSPGSADALCCGRAGAADCVRECGEPAAGAVGGATAGDGYSRVDRLRAGAHDAAVAD